MTKFVILPAYGRILGIDVGTKWVGLARTDLLCTSANSIGTYHVDDVFEKLEQLVANDQIKKIVVGWPLTPEGGHGRAIKMVKRFLKKLHAHFPDMEVDEMDERYTSKEAVAAMAEAGVPKMKQRDTDRVNRAAAAIILQKYLKLEEQ